MLEIEPDRITLTYEHGGGDIHTASYEAQEMTGTSVIDWLAATFEAFEFGAVSVRINKEQADNAFVRFDNRMKDIIEGVPDAAQRLEKLKYLLRLKSLDSECGETGDMGWFIPKDVKEKILKVLDTSS